MDEFRLPYKDEYIPRIILGTRKNLQKTPYQVKQQKPKIFIPIGQWFENADTVYQTFYFIMALECTYRHKDFRL